MSNLTVKELRDILNKLVNVDDFPVALQIDPEGNGYHYVRGVEIGMATGDSYRPEEVYGPEADENPEEYFLEKGEYEPNCLLVYP